ncbi:MAG: hypothetical protein K0R24_607 [Gammaproteobacteria bacterium]|jgi:TonB family protein|nr:hypothetical protein [Gammaproteobacteria bacterium]
MRNKVAKVIQRNSFWLVLLCHCLLFSGVSFVWALKPALIKIPDDKEKPSLFIPSYVYHDMAAPAMGVQEKVLPPKALPQSKLGIKKPVMVDIRQLLNTHSAVNISRSPETEPVHLIGDKKIDKPLLTLLGKALTAHLIYPKSAIDLNVKGTSVIGFLLYPNGQVSDVQLLRTSKAEVLDRAALAAASAIAPVHHVADYIDKPKFMVIGILFE